MTDHAEAIESGEKMIAAMDVACPPPGIYRNIPFEVYKGWPSLNSSSMDARSGAHTAANMTTDKPDTPAMAFGRMLHAAVLEPDELKLKYAVKKLNWSTIPGKAERATFAECGLTPVKAEEWDAAERIRDEIAKHPKAVELLASSEREASIIWDNGGLLRKARLDAPDFDGGAILDVKTTEDASTDGFRKSIRIYDYDRQASFYCDGVYELTGVWPAFYWLVVEKSAPFGVNLIEASPTMLQLGAEKWEAAVKAYREYTPGEPAYSREVTMVEPEYFELRKWGITTEDAP